MLVVIAGPSGAGKDTLLGRARDALQGDGAFRFVRRVITRPETPGDEDHEPVDETTFARRRDSGGFALHWRAHGLFYGIPSDIGLDIAEGRVVVASLSRTLVAEAAQRFPTHLIEITAPTDLLARRLAARGREDAVDTARRLARAVRFPDGLPRETVVNDGTIEQGARRLIAALGRLRPAGPAA